MTQTTSFKPNTLVTILTLLSSLCVVTMAEQINFNYSMKNVPIPPKQEYFLELIHSVREFETRMKWRAHFFLNPQPTGTKKETFGFNTTNAAPIVDELKTLEDNLYNLVKSIEFREHTNKFQNKLKHDVKEIKNEDKVLIKADKTTNFYKLEKAEYEEYMHRNVTKEYKKASDKDFEKVTQEDKALASKLDIDDRVYTTAKREAFITLKDHKPNYINEPTFRLINPSKQELGKVSKQKMEGILKVVQEKTGLKLWKNNTSVITWFRSLPNKERLKFIQFDICEFYPSISNQLLAKSIKFAEKFIDICDDDKKLFYQTKKPFLFCKNQPWVKKGDQTCNFTMGSYDGAEICELCDLYLLSLLVKVIPDLGLYRDDGLAVTRTTARQTEKLAQKLVKIFENEGLKITIITNKQSVNFLDVNFDLRTGEYKPYIKPNDTPIYVHSQSNHPKKVLDNIPLGVNDRLNRISANRDIFEAASPPYQEALRKSGYNHKLEFVPPQDTTNRMKKKCRSRPVTWFNPPWNSAVKTNVGKKFLRIIDTSFSNDNPLKKLFNRSTVKVSYKTMPNMSSIVSSHNTRLLNSDSTQQQEEGCNCKDGPDTCPLNPAECKKSSVIYVGSVTSTEGVEHYTGLTGGSFKKRWLQHQSDFRLKQKKTTLSTHVCRLKEEGKRYTVKWEIMDRAPVYNPVTRKCRLCLKEIFYILFRPDSASLNNRSELFNTCRHRKQKLLEKA